MQGQRSSISALPENLTFDHGSTSSSDAGIDSQLSWNTMQTSGQARLPEFRISSGETNIPYIQNVRREMPNVEWNFGESSSSASQHHQGGGGSSSGQNERKPEHSWTFRPQGSLTFEDRQFPPSNILSLDNVDLNSNANHATNGSFVLQNSISDVLPHDLNMNSEIGDQADDDCQVIEPPAAYLSIGSSMAQARSTGDSSVPFSGPPGYAMEESESRANCSLAGRRISCKRKALEGHVGQSSGSGSLSAFQNVERNQWHTGLASQNSATNISTPMQIGNDFVMNNRPDQANPRLRLGVGGAVPTNPFSLTAPSGSSTHRNFRLRFNGSHQQYPTADIPFSTESSGNGNADASSSRRLGVNNRMFELNPPPVMENVNLHGQSVLLPAPAMRRSHPLRWGGASATRASSSSIPAIPEVRPSVLYPDPMPRIIPRSISEHPLFVPTTVVGTSSQNPANWNIPGGNNNISGNVVCTSQPASSHGAGSSAPGWSRRSCPQYPRRLSEFVRRSLLSSAGTAAQPGSHRNNRAVQPNSAASQEAALPPGPDYHRHRASSSRSAMLGRHHDGAIGIPYSLRTLAAASEGRGGIMSEHIRHVLDLMRRGEGLRLEDVMILEHPVFFGMADMHDRHQDMRMDVDNMSYEELLALEERIGNVCTGLTEETVTTHLKQQKYINKPEGHVETEPCSICREEYKDGENVGMLDCGHNFHTDCIKQWLMQKNLCPICKATGLNTP